MWTTASRTSTPAPAKTPRPSLTPEQRQAQREERIFRQGQAAAARLIRALAVPNRAVQLSVAKALLDATKQADALIIRELGAAYDLVRWTEDDPESHHALNLRKWHTGPDAIGTESVDHASVAVPA